jgi:hypothetical protein
VDASSSSRESIQFGLESISADSMMYAVCTIDAMSDTGESPSSLEEQPSPERLEESSPGQ